MCRISPFTERRRRYHPYRNVTRKEEIYLDESDMIYTMTIGIGKPKRVFYVVVDTGSCDLWVVDEDCKGPLCHHKERYNIDDSISGARLSRTFRISYLDSYVAGSLVQDHLWLSSSRADNFLFGAATVISGDGMKGTLFDGILGLCPKGSKFGHEGLVENLYRNKQIGSKVFNLVLGRHPWEDGRIIFGRIATEYCASDIHWLNVGRKDKWIVWLKSFKVGKHELKTPGHDSIAALDSGTNTIIVPVEVAKSIHHRIGALYSQRHDSYEVECELIGSLPNVTIKLGHLEVHLEPDHYIYVHDRGCFSAFDGRDINKQGKEVWILGSPFLRSHVTVYDMERERFGIALPDLGKNSVPGRCCPNIDLEQ